METAPFVVESDPLRVGKDLIKNRFVDPVEVLVKIPTTKEEKKDKS